MRKIMHDRAVKLLVRLWVDRRGQDLIEYALLAAAGVVAVAGVLPNTINPLISKIFSTVTSHLSSAGG